MLALEVIILCHIVGTLYHFIGNIEIYYGIEFTWLHKYEIIDLEWHEKYM